MQKLVELEVKRKKEACISFIQALPFENSYKNDTYFNVHTEIERDPTIIDM